MPGESESFSCQTCGKPHAGHPTDTAYTLPDELWSIPESERAGRAKWTADLCQFGERHFFRCLLPLPFQDREGYYGWGVWVEVDRPTFEHYIAVYDVDALDEPVAVGRLANDIPTYGGTLGLVVKIHFGASTARPTLSFEDDDEHQLAEEADTGLSDSRYHEILAARGLLN